MIKYKHDKIIESVLNKIKTRADLGMVKYGTSMERKDVDTLGWLRHAQEEALDLANYLERLIQDEIKKPSRPYPTTAQEHKQGWHMEGNTKVYHSYEDYCMD